MICGTSDLWPGDLWFVVPGALWHLMVGYLAL